MSVNRLDTRSDDANPDTWEYEPKRPVISKRDFIFGALRDWRRGDGGRGARRRIFVEAKIRDLSEMKSKVSPPAPAVP